MFINYRTFWKREENSEQSENPSIQKIKKKLQNENSKSFMN